MKSDILATSDWAFLGSISVLLFVGIFLFALYRVLRPGAAAYYEPFRSMPLDDARPVEALAATATTRDPHA